MNAGLVVNDFRYMAGKLALSSGRLGQTTRRLKAVWVTRSSVHSRLKPLRSWTFSSVTGRFRSGMDRRRREDLIESKGRLAFLTQRSCARNLRPSISRMKYDDPEG